MQIGAPHSGFFDFLLVRVELVDHELARGLEDHLLFVAERKVHWKSPSLIRPAARASYCRPSRGLACRRRAGRWPTGAGGPIAAAIVRSASRRANRAGW